MATRDGALARATHYFDKADGFRRLLADLVAIPSTAQEEGREADLQHYLDGARGHRCGRPRAAESP